MREPWGKFGKGWEVQKNYAAITAPYYHAVHRYTKSMDSRHRWAHKQVM